MKGIKVSESTHARLLEIAQARGFSVDTILNLVFQRVNHNLNLKVGHCSYCKLPLSFSWEELDALANKQGYHHSACKEEPSSDENDD